MKSRLLLGMSLGLALSALAPGVASATTASGLDPMMLGGVDAVLQFCTRTDASHTDAYAALRVKKFGGRSPSVLTAAAQTPQYHDAFTQIDGVLSAAPLPWATKSCLKIIGFATTG